MADQAVAASTFIYLVQVESLVTIDYPEERRHPRIGKEGLDETPSGHDQKKSKDRKKGNFPSIPLLGPVEVNVDNERIHCNYDCNEDDVGVKSFFETLPGCHSPRHRFFP